VLAAAVATIAALESVRRPEAAAIDRRDALLNSLVAVDVWTGDFERIRHNAARPAAAVCDDAAMSC